MLDDLILKNKELKEKVELSKQKKERYINLLSKIDQLKIKIIRNKLAKKNDGNDDK